MRNRNRIDPFLTELGGYWKRYAPDIRFGQLMSNFISEYGDPFYLEEAEFMEKFREYILSHTM